jgi:hypothetical protein
LVKTLDAGRGHFAHLLRRAAGGLEAAVEEGQVAQPGHDHDRAGEGVGHDELCGGLEDPPHLGILQVRLLAVASGAKTGASGAETGSESISESSFVIWKVFAFAFFNN